ncbi:SAM-dependent methyltransferase [bacterium]|nr:SAM-dependent methyltransferase [bacterium]
MSHPTAPFLPSTQWITTQDGSVTLMGPHLEPYHSVHGALTESQHVYQQAGLAYWHQQHPHATTCHLLEVGYGTGLNASVACTLTRPGVSLHYTGLDPHPLDPSTLSPLLHSLPTPVATQLAQLNALSWGDRHVLSPSLSIQKHPLAVQDWVPHTPIDVLFLDAFSPTIDPALWDPTCLALYASFLRSGGVLVTYCAKGTVRRGLMQAGLIVTRLPGPPGKHHMLRGIQV